MPGCDAAEPSSLPTDPRSRIWHLARSDAPISPADPIGDQASVLLGRLLPREVTGVERMNLVVRDEVVEVLVVRPRHEVIIASGEDLGRRGDRREKVAQDRVLFWVMPHEACGLRDPLLGRQQERGLRKLVWADSLLLTGSLPRSMTPHRSSLPSDARRKDQQCP
jgi:hypothetical protein